MGSAFSQKNCFWIAGIRASNDPTTRPQGPVSYTHLTLPTNREV